MLISKLDQYGKLAWLTVTVLAFMLAWPAGAAVIAYLVWSGRVQTWRTELPQSASDWFSLRQGRFARGWTGFKSTASSGNRAFDEYRDETLRRLEQEQRDFQAFLERLRQARDKSEFDAFMAEQRQRHSASAE